MMQFYFWACMILIGIALVLGIGAVWGAVKGDAVWQSLTTVILVFVALCAAAGVQQYFGKMP